MSDRPEFKSFDSIPRLKRNCVITGDDGHKGQKADAA